jgi:nucleotide-binding universal stress UspA family protein
VCPVTLEGMNDRSNVIVVGVDGSVGADAALDFAFREGAARGCPVEVVTAWLWVSSGDVLGHQSQVRDGRIVVRQMQDEVVDQAVTRAAATPELSQLVVHDFAGRVLSARSEGVSMLVIGSGAQTSSTDRTLGAVSEYCLRHSPVPVVIVPQPERVRTRAVMTDLSLIPA